jgi:flagellar hook-length control protein FliK
MGSKMSVTTMNAPPATATRSTEAAAGRDSSAGASPADGFTSAMNAAAQPNTAAANTNSKAAPASNSTSNTSTAVGVTDDASNGAASIAASDASAIDASAVSQDGGTLDKSTGKSRSTGASASATSSAPATLAMLLAAAGLQPTSPGSTAPADNAGDSSKGGDDQNSTAQSAAAAIAAAGFAIGVASTLANAPSAATAGPAGAAAAGIAASATPAAAAGHPANDASLIKFDSLMAGSASADSSSGDTALLQTKSSTDDSSPTPPTSAMGPNGLPEMVRSLVSTASQTAGAERTIAIPVSDRNWSSAVAAQVQWQVNSNVQSATLQLSPDHLGPLEVRIDVQSSQVNVSFSANHADTRLALEQSVPRLREILANSGLTLGQTSVQQEARSGSQFTPPVSRTATRESQDVEPISISSTRAIGLIDEYA